MSGFFIRFHKKLYVIKLIFFEIFKITKIKSHYGPLFHSNYRDKTFNFYICASYGYYYWDHITNKQDKFIFLDIGSNQGLYAICASYNKNCHKVYAFETVKNTFKLLQKNIALNNLDSKCELISKAVSNKSGETTISIKPTHSGAASISKEQDIGSENIVNEKILSIDGEDLANIINFDKSSSIIVKIDVEGFEKSVILGLISSPFIENIDEIFYEINERWVNPSEIENLLSNVGFAKFEKIGDGKEHYDVLATRQTKI